MLNYFLVRLMIGCLLVLGIKFSVFYFLFMVFLFNIYYKEFFGW